MFLSTCSDVMRGLDPRIQLFAKPLMDRRVKPGDDGYSSAAF